MHNITTMLKSLRRARVTTLLGFALAVAFIIASISVAACPAGDPSVLYCDDFSGPNPLGQYIVINPLPGNSPFIISITNQALTFTNVLNTGLAFSHVLSNVPLTYKNTIYEVDVRMDTPDPYLRSAVTVQWTSLDLTTLRFGFALQLDEKSANFFLGVQGQFRDLKTPFQVQPNTTYRLALKVEEAPGVNRPMVYGFVGYIDGTQIFSTTEESLGLDMSSSPAQVYPSFVAGSYSWASVTQIFDNAIVRKQTKISCTGFEPPIGTSPVSVKKFRSLPLKARLFDEQNAPVTKLSPPPVVQVTYSPQTGNHVVDITNAALPGLVDSPGNQFASLLGKWLYILDTRAYTAPGTYTITMVSGSNGYLIQPTCTGIFVVR